MNLGYLFPLSCSSAITTRTSYTAPALCEQVEEGKKKKKIIPKKEWIMFFSYCSRPWLTPADAKKVPTFLSRVFLHLFLPYSELSKCLCYWSFLARISTWLPAYLSFNHFSLNPYTSNIPLKCHSQLSRQNYLTIQNHLNIQNHSSFLCVNFNININVCHLPVI